MESKVTVTSLLKMKQEGKKIVMLTAYDYLYAKIADEAGVDVLLVGDSLAMVVQGKENTLPVTMDEMVYHTEMVARAAKRAMVVGDMPFMSYQASVEEAIRNAGRFLKEGGASSVKVEGGAQVSKLIKALTTVDIPVMAHIGLTPQSIHKLGGFKVQRDEDRLISDALTVEDAGAYSVVLECIPQEVSQKITERLTIPTIGIGAGSGCDGQVLVIHDVLGLFERFVPKFVKQYAQLGKKTRKAISQYVREVQEGVFPSSEHTYK
ncbi:MAG TPA: 3-methyl-2-oxobutanoate hydroxymethyltransferase [Syntrophaceae bacterium]|nr:3-methyl-2-oxobutanoate hydroxymethyltransferase [Syntrophaceae bacterium]